jgi:hypothetical protein
MLSVVRKSTEPLAVMDWAAIHTDEFKNAR